MDNKEPSNSAQEETRYPIGGQMSDVVAGLLNRLRLPELLQRHTSIVVLALFSGLNSFLSIALITVVALLTKTPLIFPSLGPTAFLCFYTPNAQSASPRNTLIGHAIGVCAGYLSLLVTGLADTGPALVTGVTWPRVFAAALALGLTSSTMVLMRSPHPPAGATTLIIALGILTKPWQLFVLMLGVTVLAAQAIIINRAAGLDYPIWRQHRTSESVPKV